MFKNLLLAVDVNAPEGASKTAQVAASLARTDGATLHLLNVVPDNGMAIVSASLSPNHVSEIVSKAHTELDAWAKSKIPDDIIVKTHVSEGTVYDQIIKAAEALSIDAIVIGSHRPELKDYLIGPNAARVARHAPQSVFVVR